MNGATLVAYATKHGSTLEVAAAIAAALRDRPDRKSRSVRRQTCGRLTATAPSSSVERSTWAAGTKTRRPS